jgi:hypothetical protein
MAQMKSGIADAHPAHRKVSFYFAAHPDDWQLFMNPMAFLDVLDDAAKVVFVHVTAGDAGLGTGTGGRKQPHYLARENGAEIAIRFMADANTAPEVWRVSDVPLNGHAIRRAAYKNTASYFLRLPDGSPAGSGYPETGHQSLQRLACEAIGTFTAIDGSATYRGWLDLVATLREIVDAERGVAASIDLHIAELDASANPDDHSDHLATAKAVLEATHAAVGVRLYHHIEYASSNLPENLSSQARDMKSAVYAVTIAGLQAMDHGGAWRHYDESFVGRDYFRMGDGTKLAERPLAATAAAW